MSRFGPFQRDITRSEAVRAKVAGSRWTPDTEHGTAPGGWKTAISRNPYEDGWFIVSAERPGAALSEWFQTREDAEAWIARLTP